MNALESPRRPFFVRFAIVTIGVAALALPLLVLFGAFWMKVGATEITSNSSLDSPYRLAGTLGDFGPGGVRSVTPDGRAVLVSVPDPGSKTGCEGMPAESLFRVPLDGGPRQLATPASTGAIGGDVVARRLTEPVVGNPAPSRAVQVMWGPNVAVVGSCEKVLDDLTIGTETYDGRLTDVHTLKPANLSPFGLSWAADGYTLIGTTAGRAANEVVRINPDTGAVSTIRSGADALQAAELPDGTLVVLTKDGVEWGGLHLPVRGLGFTVAPDGRSLAVFGEDGLTVVAPGREIRLATGPVGDAAWSPDGDALGYIRNGAVRVVTMSGHTTSVVMAGGYGIGGFARTPNGLALVFTGTQGDGHGNLTPAVKVARLER